MAQIGRQRPLEEGGEKKWAAEGNDYIPQLGGDVQQHRALQLVLLLEILQALQLLGIEDVAHVVRGGLGPEELVFEALLRGRAALRVHGQHLGECFTGKIVT